MAPTLDVFVLFNLDRSAADFGRSRLVLGVSSPTGIEPHQARYLCLQIGFIANAGVFREPFVPSSSSVSEIRFVKCFSVL